MIQLKGISVAYRLIRERPRTFQENIINYLKGKRVQPETLWALKGLSFDVNKGDCLGVIGHNGAGKSTLLKVISNVIKPLEGSIRVHGKLAPLIEISAGFDPELTARENIFLNTSILGFTRKEIESKFSNIIAFTELEDFINTPLKNFSSGMTALLL
jgi:ABC-2 type transport system ATP-binding protein/lipopolysaccharide transport system ATP-binding protein